MRGIHRATPSNRSGLYTLITTVMLELLTRLLGLTGEYDRIIIDATPTGTSFSAYRGMGGTSGPTKDLFVKLRGYAGYEEWDDVIAVGFDVTPDRAIQTVRSVFHYDESWNGPDFEAWFRD